MSNREVGIEVTLNPQRKAAIAGGGAFDHAGRVRVEPMADFDIDRTIFGGLSGLPRRFMVEKLMKEPVWSGEVSAEIDAAYRQVEDARPAPEIDQRLIDFMVNECDFSMEHADGTFLEHLVFCHDYSAHYYPQHSPVVALLHSMLGTATNTFPMTADKIPAMNELLTDFESLHVEAFPSTLRLLYDGGLLPELDRNMGRLDQLEGVRFYRVIDNEPLMLDAENLWINLNFHLMHLVDFVPSANWSSYRADPLLQMFEKLSGLLDRAGQRQAKVEVSFPQEKVAMRGESLSGFGRITSLLPPSVSLKLARKSIRDYSAKAGHDLSYELIWR